MPEVQIQGTWNDDFRHAHERMKVAVESLVGTGTMAYRLGGALHTMFHFLRADEFPEELKEEYQRIIDECSTIKHTGNESDFDATIRRMSPKKKREIAERIVDLYDSIATDYWLPDSLWPYSLYEKVHESMDMKLYKSMDMKVSGHLQEKVSREIGPQSNLRY